MTIATLIGRLETKLVTYGILASVTAVFALLNHPAYIIVGAIAAVIGLLLEAAWGTLITYQPGWLTFLLSFIEFGLISITAAVINLPITLIQAAFFYAIIWIPTQLFLLYILPVWAPQWGDNGTELW